MARAKWIIHTTGLHRESIASIGSTFASSAHRAIARQARSTSWGSADQYQPTSSCDTPELFSLPSTAQSQVNSMAATTKDWESSASSGRATKPGASIRSRCSPIAARSLIINGLCWLDGQTSQPPSHTRISGWDRNGPNNAAASATLRPASEGTRNDTLPREGQAFGKRVAPVIAGCPWLCAQEEHSRMVRKCMVERPRSMARGHRIIHAARLHSESIASGGYVTTQRLTLSRQFGSRARLCFGRPTPAGTASRHRPRPRSAPPPDRTSSGLERSLIEAAFGPRPTGP